MTKHPEDDVFTGTQVGTLIESFRNDISVIAEDVHSLREDVAILKEDVKEIKTHLITVEDVIRVSIPDIYARVTRLETKTGI